MESKELWPILHARLRVYLGKTWDVDGLSKAIGVTPGTLGEWLTTSRPANGERLIRMWHYFAAIGIDSPEVQELPAINRYAGELLAMNILTMDDLGEVFGVRNAQTVLQILRGTPPMRPLMSYRDLKDIHDTKLEAQKARLPSLGDEEGAEELLNQPPISPSVSPSAMLKEVRSGDRDYTLKPAVALSSVLPLCRHLNSDSCTSQDRSRFRDLIGSEALFELSNTLGSLCGERARNNLR